MLSFYEKTQVFFLCRIKNLIRDGGGNFENTDYLGLHRVQTEKLQHDERQKSYA